MADTPKCELCGELMPAGEESFKYHGYSGPCPKSNKKSTKEKHAETLQVLARKGYLWPSGEFGIVSLKMGDSKIELTFDQAKTLANKILMYTQK